MSLPVLLTSLSMIISGSIHSAANSVISFFFWPSSILLSICTMDIHPFICHWTFGLFPWLVTTNLEEFISIYCHLQPFSVDFFFHPHLKLTSLCCLLGITTKIGIHERTFGETFYVSGQTALWGLSNPCFQVAFAGYLSLQAGRRMKQIFESRFCQVTHAWSWVVCFNSG